MLNNFCFHVYAQKSLFIVENCNAFLGPQPWHHDAMAEVQFGKGGPDGPRSPLPNWILAIFLVQFFSQTRVIFSSLVCYLFIAASASPWLL